MIETDTWYDPVIYEKSDGVEYIKFKNLEKYNDLITHGFTTRRGGVSTGECSSLNLGFNRNDCYENVMENYKRIAGCLGIDPKNMVLSRQVHDNKIRTITEEDRGKGIFFENDLVGYDGLMTDRKHVALVTFYADCVPVFFFDPVREVIAISHSGWRGTVKEIARETVLKMLNEFNCSVEDIEVAIGPSIGQCCFETGEEVYEEFIRKFAWANRYCKQGEDKKWYINLPEIIRKTLLGTGICNEKISTSGICTRCHKDTFFSHRGDQGKTGSLAAIMQLK